MIVDPAGVAECAALNQQVALDREHYEQARDYLERALSLLADEQTVRVNRNRLALAQALWDGELDRERAEALAAQARRELADSPKDDFLAQEQVGAAAAWFEERGLPLP